MASNKRHHRADHRNRFGRKPDYAIRIAHREKLRSKLIKANSTILIPETGFNDTSDFFQEVESYMDIYGLYATGEAFLDLWDFFGLPQELFEHILTSTEQKLQTLAFIARRAS